MKKALAAISLVCIFGFGAWLLTSEEIPPSAPARSIARVMPEKKPIIPEKNFDIAVVDASRRPATEPKAKKRERKITIVMDKSDPVTVPPVSPRYLASISKSLKVIADHYALKQEDYTPSMGEVIVQFNKMVIVKSARRPLENAANVAYDESDQTYHPIATVLKLRDIDEEKRQQLLSQGAEENYYNQDLKLMYLQGTHESIIKMFSDAREQGYKADLELIGDFYRPR